MVNDISLAHRSRVGAGESIRSFKPNLLRYTNNMAEKACHVVGSATQVGLTQALAIIGEVCSVLKKMLILEILFVASLALPAPVHAATEVRANYEIEVKSEDGRYSTRTTETISNDGVFSQELGPFNVVLSPNIAGDGSYKLEVTVTRIAKSATSITPTTSRSYTGYLGGPLEFTADFGGSVVSGSIFISYHRQ